jgi:PAS domain S-box-containing protein
MCQNTLPASTSLAPHLQLTSLLDTLPDAVIFLNEKATIQYANASAARMLEASTHELPGKDLRQCAPHIVTASFYQAVMTVTHTRKPLEMKYRCPVTRSWLRVYLSPTRDGIAVFFHEDTESTQLHEEEELRALVDAIPHFVWISRPDGSTQYSNRQWCDYTGSTSEPIQGDEWLQFIHPDDRQRIQETWQTAVRTGTPYEVAHRIQNGRTGDYRWFLARALPIRDEAGQITRWFGTCTDIEDQKRIEEALRQSQERVSVLMNSNMIGINIIEGEQIVDANDTFLRMTGYTREDLRAGRMNWMHMTPLEYLPPTRQAHQELVTRQSMTYEKEYVCKDGSRLPVLVCGVVLQHHPFQAIGFVLDNSARKELEQRKDDFINMASHEFRTPLTSVKMQAQLVRRRLVKQGLDEAAASLLQVEVPIKQLERLVGELLDVSKIQAGGLEYAQEPVDLEALLGEVAKTMQQMSTTHAVLMHGAAPHTLIGDKGRLEQVFIILISNAIKYSPGATTVEIDLSASTDTVTVSVRDHGIGIPQEQREKIFERFYRVSDLRQGAIPGLGMGLHIVAEIVRHHGGTMRIESDMGHGSTFHVTLPLKSPITSRSDPAQG